MSNENKGAAGGAVRKTEEGAKAPDSPTEEVPGGAAVSSGADKVAADKVKKAANDKASKIKREKEAAAKKVVEAEAAKRHGAYVAQGMSLTSCKGTVAGAPAGAEAWKGDKVTEEHWGKEVFKRLVADGAVIEIK